MIAGRARLLLLSVILTGVACADVVPVRVEAPLICVGWKVTLEGELLCTLEPDATQQLATCEITIPPDKKNVLVIAGLGFEPVRRELKTQWGTRTVVVRVDSRDLNVGNSSHRLPR